MPQKRYDSIDAASIGEIMKEDQTYILTEKENRDWGLDMVDLLYAIRRPEELLPSIDMEMRVMRAEYREVREIVCIREIGKNTHAIEIRCLDRDTQKEAIYKLYLQRIYAFDEMLPQMKELYGVD